MTSGFGALVAALDPGLVVVTAAGHDGRQVDGCLVGFHSQSSIDPPRYVVWLSKVNHTYQLALTASHLGVHRIETTQHDLAERFGGRTADDGVDKLASETWQPGPGGVPMLIEVADRFAGKVVARLEAGGDHAAFVLEPVEGSAVTDPKAGPSLRLSDAEDIQPGHGA